MKIAIPTEDRKVSHSQFGRAAAFAIVDTASNQIDFLDNSAATEAAHGAGIRTAERVAGAAVAAVLSEAVGPKAAEVLRSAGVTMWKLQAGTSFADAALAYSEGRLEKL